MSRKPSTDYYRRSSETSSIPPMKYKGEAGYDKITTQAVFTILGSFFTHMVVGF